VSRDRLGFYSPFLTASQKAELRRLEEGLESGDQDLVAQATQAFLQRALELTRDALLEFCPRLNLDTLVGLRDSDEDSELADQLRQMLWNGERLSPFAQRLLAWQEGKADPSELLLSVPELNDYLAASVDFYAGLRPICPGGEIEPPVWNLLEPPRPPSLELPEVIEELEQAPAEEAEPMTVIELSWNPEVDYVPDRPAPPEPEETPVVLKLLWEQEPQPVPEGDSAAVQEPRETLFSPAVPEPQENPQELKVLLLESREPLSPAPPRPQESEASELLEDASLLFEEAPEFLEEEPGLAEDASLLFEEAPEFLEEEPGLAEDASLLFEEAPEFLEEPPQPVEEMSRLVESEAVERVVPRGPAPSPEDEDGTELIGISAAPLSPLEQRNQLIVKKKYLGYGKNSDGVMGYCGQLTLSRYDDSPLEARLECSNPLLFLSHSTTSGKAPVVTYWMPPAAFPQPSGHLTISLQGQNKVLSVGSLFPQSRTDFLSGAQVLLVMLAPSLLGLLYFAFVYLLSASGIVGQVQETFPEAYAAALSGSSIADFRSHGVGLYQLEIVPAAESLQLIWAALIWLCPLLAAKFFRHLSRARQREMGTGLAAAMVLPSLGLLLLWNAQKSVFPLFYHADFSPLDLRNFLPWSVPLNLAVASYLFLSVHGVWDRLVSSRELRFLLPVVLGLLYLLIGFVVIFGRSWLA
jgi:hypothetical protein